MFTITSVSSSPRAIAVNVVLMPAMSGRHSATNPIVWLPHATASAISTSSGALSRRLASWFNASIAQWLATSPAAWPPTPSATAAIRGLANTASSLFGRPPTPLPPPLSTDTASSLFGRRPTSLRHALSSVSAVMPPLYLLVREADPSRPRATMPPHGRRRRRRQPAAAARAPPRLRPDGLRRPAVQPRPHADPAAARDRRRRRRQARRLRRAPL